MWKLIVQHENQLNQLIKHENQLIKHENQLIKYENQLNQLSKHEKH